MQHEVAVKPQLELSLADFGTSGASIAWSEKGITFAVTIWPLSDATAVALDELAQNHGRICLRCCGRPLLFDLVELERKEPRKARIVGRIVGGLSYAMGKTA